MLVNVEQIVNFSLQIIVGRRNDLVVKSSFYCSIIIFDKVIINIWYLEVFHFYS